MMDKTVLRAALDDAFRLYFDNLFRVLMIEKTDEAFERFCTGLKRANEMYARIERHCNL
jgi:hypothetical protein